MSPVAERFAAAYRRARTEWAWWTALVVGGVLVSALCHTVLTRSGVQETHRTLSVDALGPETRVVVLGSSHVYLGFDPNAMSAPTVNLAGEAFDYCVMESILAAHLPRLDGLSTLVVELDVFPLHFDSLDWYDGDFTAFLEFEPDLSTLDVDPRLDARLHWDQTVAYSPVTRPFLNREKLPPGRIVELLKGKWRGATPGFFRTGRVIFEKNVGAKIIEAHWKSARLGREGRNLAALERIIQMARDKGVRVVLVRFPKHQSFRDAFPSEWHALRDEGLATLRARFPDASLDVWNFEEMDGLSDEDFADANHLNASGARKFTSRMALRFPELLE